MEQNKAGRLSPVERVKLARSSLRPGRTFAMCRATWLKKMKNRVERNAGSLASTTVPSSSVMGARHLSHWQVSPWSSMLMETTRTDFGMFRIFSSTLRENASTNPGFVSQKLEHFCRYTRSLSGKRGRRTRTRSGNS